jgi:hypothetical protein
MFEFLIDFKEDDVDKEYIQLVYILQKEIKPDRSINNNIIINDSYCNLRELLEWFIINKEYILNEKLPSFLNKYNNQYFSIPETIAAYLDLFVDEETPPDNEYDMIHGYMGRHCVVFGSTGTDIMYTYFGKNNGKLEMAYFYNNISFRCEISMDRFYDCLSFPLIPTTMT